MVPKDGSHHYWFPRSSLWWQTHPNLCSCLDFYVQTYSLTLGDPTFLTITNNQDLWPLQDPEDLNLIPGCMLRWPPTELLFCENNFIWQTKYFDLFLHLGYCFILGHLHTMCFYNGTICWTIWLTSQKNSTIITTGASKYWTFDVKCIRGQQKSL